jgi:hypothetical protein
MIGCSCLGQCGRHTGRCGAVDGTLHPELRYRHCVSERNGAPWCDVCWALQLMGGRPQVRESRKGQLEVMW